jgi:SprT-like family
VSQGASNPGDQADRVPQRRRGTGKPRSGSGAAGLRSSEPLAEATLFDLPNPNLSAQRLPSWPEALPRALEPRLFEWLHAWDAHALIETMTIETSSRMRSSLGRAYLDRRLVRLNALLIAPGREALLDEVFCHEVAHLVVHERHGRRAAPHGREWRALLRQVGSPVRVTIPRDECAFLPPEQRRGRRRRRRRAHRGRAAQPSFLGGLLSVFKRFHGRLM